MKNQQQLFLIFTLRNAVDYINNYNHCARHLISDLINHESFTVRM